MKKKVVSIIVVLIFAIAILVALQNKMLQKKSKEDTGLVSHVETQTIGRNKNNATTDKKVLDASYLPQMQEEFIVSNASPTDSGNYSMEITDACLTRNVNQYSSKFDSPYYYNNVLSQFVDSNGIYGEGAYYIVVTAEITNTGDGTRELLIPGNYWIYFMDGKLVDGDVKNQQYSEIQKGVVIDGNNSVSAKGHFKLEHGEKCSIVLISSITEEKLVEYEQDGKSIYISAGNIYIKNIPNDENKVKFIKLNFRYEE